MFCPSCGANVPENFAFCQNCGFNLNSNQQAQQQYQQPQYQQPQYQQPQYQQPPYQQPFAPATPMAWYKFLIYFMLFASAILNVIGGIAIMTGGHYGSEAKTEMVYEVFEGLQFVDIVVGLGSLVLAGLAIATRIHLAGYRKSGPSLLKTLYTVSAGLNLFQIIGYSIIIESVTNSYGVRYEPDYSSAFVSVAVSIAMICANKVYFDKRAALFTR